MTGLRRLLAPSAVVAFVAVAAAVSVGLFVVPPDRLQGQVQRIMYVHVPSAWIAYLAFFVTFVASIRYLWRKDLGADRLAASSAEIGLVFTGVAIATGAIWGKATWGVWWDWDPRLTTTALLFLIFAGYVLVRASVVDRVARARACAVIGIVGFANVPIVHFSVLWWRSLHQPPTVIRPGDPSIDHLLLAELLAKRARLHGALPLPAWSAPRPRTRARRGRPGAAGVVMTDIAFVAGAYLVALGALVVYAATLVRRLRAARSARAAIDRARPPPRPSRRRRSHRHADARPAGDPARVGACRRGARRPRRPRGDERRRVLRDAD